MDTGILSLGMYLNWFQNISILVVLILLYNYIPARIFIKRDIYFSVLVGAIFSFAVIMAILIQWTETSHSNIGLNAILIPLAGITGGIVSAGIITGFLHTPCFRRFRRAFPGSHSKSNDIPRPRSREV
ncbi:MAG: hypothetical protein V1862_10455 [Methanobacteriota archaeon]